MPEIDPLALLSAYDTALFIAQYVLDISIGPLCTKDSVVKVSASLTFSVTKIGWYIQLLPCSLKKNSIRLFQISLDKPRFVFSCRSWWNKHTSHSIKHLLYVIKKKTSDWVGLDKSIRFMRNWELYFTDSDICYLQWRSCFFVVGGGGGCNGGGVCACLMFFLFHESCFSFYYPWLGPFKSYL